MDFGDYVRLIRRSAWIIVALILVGIIIAGGLTLREKPQYGATATGYVSARVDSITDLSQVSAVSQQAVNSFAGVAKSAYVLNQVVQSLHLKTTAAALSQQVVAAVPANSSLVTVTATASSAEESAAIANSVMSHLNTAIHTLIPGSNKEGVALRLFTVNPATAPSSPDSPKPLRDIAFGALAGLILGLLIAVLRQVLDSRVSTLHDLERLSDRPILGLFLRDERPVRVAATIDDFTHSSAAEAFRTLRTNLRFLEGPGTSRSFIVTSPSTNEDRAELAANLAIAISDLGTRVIVVDADLRRPRLSSYLGFSNTPGLTDVLARRVPLSEAVRIWDNSTLHVLPAGSPTDNPNELVQSTPMPDLVARLQMDYDAVIFNTPPLLAASDAAIVATYTDGALLVTEMDRTKRIQLQSALTALDRVGSPVLGVAALGLKESPPARYGRLPGRRASRPSPELAMGDQSAQRIGSPSR